MQTKFGSETLARGAVAIACALALAGGAAQAGVVTASFDGSVTGGLFDPRALADHPFGTAVRWQFTFDDAFLALTAADDVSGSANQAVTGSATVGADVYVLNFARLYSYAYDINTNVISSYSFQVDGVGPQSASGGAFYGVFADFDPSLGLNLSRIGFGFSSSNVTNFGYLELRGDYRLTRNAVPAPATAWLVLPALALLVGRRRQARA